MKILKVIFGRIDYTFVYIVFSDPTSEAEWYEDEYNKKTSPEIYNTILKLCRNDYKTAILNKNHNNLTVKTIARHILNDTDFHVQWKYWDPS